MNYYPDLAKVLPKYEYDPNRAAALLAEAGYTKGGDGFFTSAAAGRLSPEVRGTIQNETAILVDSWRKAGIDAQVSITPAALATDNQYRSEFPAFAITNSQPNEPTVVTKFST